MRFGIDLGGTKTEILALGPGGQERWRKRVATVRDYDGTVRLLAELVREGEAQAGAGTVGIAIPGCETPQGLVKNANSTWLIGKPLRRDLEAALDRAVRLANDANCFALSESHDGAAAGAHVVFGVIAGTGVGGGVVVDGKVLAGAHGVGGEWGHIPLPSPSPEEVANAPDCYCGKRGCIESWCSGPAVAAEFKRVTGRDETTEAITASQDTQEQAAVGRLADRLARGLATMANILDPDVIVLGGGLSNVARLYDDLPPLIEQYAFTLGAPPRVLKNKHGDSSGIRGAAWLWPEMMAT